MRLTQHRTQLFLDEERYSWLRYRAFNEGKTLAQIVRELLDEKRLFLADKETKRKSLAYQKIGELVGSLKTGPKDLSINHDQCLAKDFAK